MRDTIDPRLEFEWMPTLWAAATVISIGLVGNLILLRPNMLAWGAFFAGLVASLSSGYYENSGHNAVVGTLLGVIATTPLLVYSRVRFGFGIEGSGDTIFITIGIALAWLIVAISILLPIAYIAALLGDITRKKVKGPLGY